MTEGTPTEQQRQNALERILRAAAGSSARLVSNGAAVAIIAYIFGSDVASLALLSPPLARLVETIGGDVWANILDRVAQDKPASPEQICGLLQEAGTKLDKVLTREKFYHAFGRLQRDLQRRERQDEQKYRVTVEKLDQLLRLTPLSEDAQPPIRGKCPLELAGYGLGQLPVAAPWNGLGIEWPMKAAHGIVPNR